MNKTEKREKIIKLDAASRVVLIFGGVLGLLFLFTSFLVFQYSFKIVGTILLSESLIIWYVLQSDINKIEKNK